MTTTTSTTTTASKFNSLAKLAIGGAMLSGALLANAGVLNFSGDTTGDPTWNRPVGSGPILSGVGTATPFEVTHFQVDASDSYAFVANSSWDNYSHLYQGAFDHLQPLTNLLVGNDDLGFIGQTGFNIALTAGTDYFYVLSGFGNNSYGTYNASISAQQGTAFLVQNAVPEPSSLALVGLALAGLLMSRRRTA